MNTTHKTRLLSLALASFSVISTVHAETFQQDFSSDPFAQGWSIFGDTNLFQVDPTNANLQVTWDSSRPNSYFYRPLGTILARDDDFSLSFDLRLSDVALDPTKPGTFQIAVGFINRADAFRENFIRGTGFESPNLAEFNFFPDSGFGATISPTIISSNHAYAYSFNIEELTVNDLFRIEMAYTAVDHTLVTRITRNGEPFGPIGDAVLGEFFDDFRLDAVAISSYSDAGQDPDWAGGILAHGVVDDIEVTVPPPPVEGFSGGLAGAQVWSGGFIGRTNWLYTLERTIDFQTWVESSETTAGMAGTNVLSDTNAPSGGAFYRIRAERP